MLSAKKREAEERAAAEAAAARAAAEAQAEARLRAALEASARRRQAVLSTVRCVSQGSRAFFWLFRV